MTSDLSQKKYLHIVVTCSSPLWQHDASEVWKRIRINGWWVYIHSRMKERAREKQWFLLSWEQEGWCMIRLLEGEGTRKITNWNSAEERGMVLAFYERCWEEEGERGRELTDGRNYGEWSETYWRDAEELLWYWSTGDGGGAALLWDLSITRN